MVAILIVALAVIAGTSVIMHLSNWESLVRAEMSRAQLKQVALGGLMWARTALRNDAAQNNVDHLDEFWNTELPLSTAEGDVEIGGSIADRQGFFNLANLLNEDGSVNERSYLGFVRMLQALDLPITLADALIDWTTPSSVSRRTGAPKDAAYLASTPPYFSANRRLTELANLRFINGYTADIIGRLEPYVTVLPRITRVNVNTAPAVVLLAYVPGLTLDEARTIVSGRKVYFRDETDFRTRLPRKDLAFNHNDIGVATNFFLVRVSVRRGSDLMKLNALIERVAQNAPTIVWEKFE